MYKGITTNTFHSKILEFSNFQNYTPKSNSMHKTSREHIIETTIIYTHRHINTYASKTKKKRVINHTRADARGGPLSEAAEAGGGDLEEAKSAELLLFGRC